VATARRQLGYVSSLTTQTSFVERYGVATGGSSSSITVSGQAYTLLTFTSTGTLTVTQAGLFDYTFVGAGGAGGTNGRGGGAGGCISQGTLYLSANETITIGAGVAGSGNAIRVPKSSHPAARLAVVTVVSVSLVAAMVVTIPALAVPLVGMEPTLVCGSEKRQQLPTSQVAVVVVLIVVLAVLAAWVAVVTVKEQVRLPLVPPIVVVAVVVLSQAVLLVRIIVAVLVLRT
jgi:hypothetical protein